MLSYEEENCMWADTPRGVVPFSVLPVSLFSAQELLKLNVHFYHVATTLTGFLFHLLVEFCLNQCKIAILLIPFLTEVRKCIVSGVKNPPSNFCSRKDNALSVPVVVCSSVLLPLSYRDPVIHYKGVIKWIVSEHKVVRNNKQAQVPLYFMALKTVSLCRRCSGVMMEKL